MRHLYFIAFLITFLSISCDRNTEGINGHWHVDMVEVLVDYTLEPQDDFFQISTIDIDNGTGSLNSESLILSRGSIEADFFNKTLNFNLFGSSQFELNYELRVDTLLIFDQESNIKYVGRLYEKNGIYCQSHINDLIPNPIDIIEYQDSQNLDLVDLDTINCNYLIIDRIRKSHCPTCIRYYGDGAYFNAEHLSEWYDLAVKRQHKRIKVVIGKNIKPAELPKIFEELERLNCKEVYFAIKLTVYGKSKVSWIEMNDFLALSGHD